MRRARRLGLEHDDSAPGVHEPPRVLLLVVSRRESAGHEHRRKTCSGKLPDRAARPGEGDVRSAVGHADLVDEGPEDVVRARDAPAQLRIVPFAAEVDDGRPCLGPGVERELVEETRAEGSSEDEDDARVLCQPEPAAGVAPLDRLRGRRDRPADGAVLLSAQAER